MPDPATYRPNKCYLVSLPKQHAFDADPWAIRTSLVLQRLRFSGNSPFAFPTTNVSNGRYGVSRYTVRAALKVLSSFGLVSSQQGVGTRVIASEPPKVFQATWKSIAEICNQSNDVSFHPIETGMQTADTELAKSLCCTSGRTFAFVRLLASIKDGSELKRVGMTEINIDPRFSEIIQNPKHDEPGVIMDLENFSGDYITRIDVSLFSQFMNSYYEQILYNDNCSYLIVIRRIYSTRDINQFSISKNTWLPHAIILDYCIDRNN